MCLYVLIGLVAPRLALFLMWLFGSPMLAPVQPWWVGVLGFLFLPFTLLAYVLIHALSGDVEGVVHMVVLLAALFLDVGAWGQSGRKARARRAA